MTAALLFASTFVLVFALGMQQFNIAGGHYRAAFLTSVAIGAANMLMLKLGPEASPLEICAYMAGGPFGIVASMHLHRFLCLRLRRYTLDERKSEC
jgi:hypothetical protein